MTYSYTEAQALYDQWLEEHLADQDARARDFRAVGDWMAEHYAPPWMLELVLEKLP